MQERAKKVNASARAVRDRSSQYTSDAFTTLLDRTQAIASLSRPGNPYQRAGGEWLEHA